MNLEECPLSKEELLKLVEEEAAMRVSASFLEQVGHQWVDNIYIFLKFLGGTRGKRGHDRWNHGHPENAGGSCEETWASSWDGRRGADCSDVVPRGPTILGPSCSGTLGLGLTSNYWRSKVKHNIMSEGVLSSGDLLPDVTLWTLDGCHAKLSKTGGIQVHRQTWRIPQRLKHVQLLRWSWQVHTHDHLCEASSQFGKCWLPTTALRRSPSPLSI